MQLYCDLMRVYWDFTLYTGLWNMLGLYKNDKYILCILAMLSALLEFLQSILLGDRLYQTGHS